MSKFGNGHGNASENTKIAKKTVLIAVNGTLCAIVKTSVKNAKRIDKNGVFR
jgi:hypothetical protein